MSETEKPGYYAIIPANVRYDKELTPNAKLLYGEITALCNDKGFCWASNDYFATLYGVSKASVSAWISQLVKNKYISLQLVYKEGSKEILNRYIRLFEYPIQENLNTPIQENLKDNTTSLNTTFNKEIPTKQEIKKDDQFIIFYQNYPKKTNKTDARKVFDKLIKSGITLDMILSKLKVYEEQITRDRIEPKYIRNPQRFLNTLDDYELPTKKQDNPSIRQACPKCGAAVEFGQCTSCGVFIGLDGKEVIL